MKHDATSTQPAVTVYFDGACPVCSREIAMYRKQVGADDCRWVDASSCDEAALGEGLSRDKALGRFHVRRADGVLVDGPRGFAVLWRALPRLAWAGRIASIEPIATLLDIGYAAFLRIRPLWQPAPSPSSWIARVDDERRRIPSSHSKPPGAGHP